MVDKRVTGYILAGAFLIAMSALFVPFLKIWGFEISIFDFLGMSSDLDELLEEYAEYTEFLQQAIASYAAPCMILLALPICEAILVFLLKGRKAIAAAASAVVVNNTIAFILYDKINDTLAYINESFLGTLLQISLQIEKPPIVIWIFAHLIIVGVITVSVVLEYFRLKKEKEEDFTGTKEVIMEQFHLKKRSTEAEHYGKKDIELIGEKSASPFYGGIIGETGNYKEKAYLLKKEEKVSLGSEETDDIFIVGALEKTTFCLISYDTDREEYHVRPLHKNAVFLKSRQPLGKDRVYCIPRGKTLIIDSKKNMFTLA